MRVGKLLTATAFLICSSAHAQAPYPDQPIRFVLGSAAGSGPDIIARVMSERLSRAWGPRIVVDARPGVAGVLAGELVSRSTPDGYTWMMLTSQLLVAASVYPNLKFNIAKDFTSISLIGTVPFVLVVNSQVPAKSVSELIELAKSKPGALRYGSAGAGASEHLSGFLLNRLSGTNMLHVPYKGIAQAVSDTVSGEVHMSYPVLPAALPMIQAGRVRALGVTTPRRAALLPDVPSIGEMVPNYEMMGWYGVVAPTGTPAAVLAKVNAEMVKAVKEPEFGEQLKGLGLELVGSSRADFDAFRQEQTKRIGELVKASGVDLK